ncbi:MAG: DNA translocase FtsK [Lachnospiraceae bacterium]
MAATNHSSGQGTGRKTTQTKKTTTSGQRTYSKTNHAQAARKKKEQEAALRSEIMMIISFAVCILLFLCNFSIMGPFGKAVKGVMFGLFGVLSYVVPIAAFIGMAFHVSNRGSQVAARKLVAGGVLLYCIGIFAQMIAVPIGEIEGNLISELFLISRNESKGGGLLCGLLAYPMMKYLKSVGSVLVLLVVMIIALVIITERSFIGGVRSGGHKMYESAKDSARRRRDERHARREEAMEEEEELYEETSDRQKDRRQIHWNAIDQSAENGNGYLKNGSGQTAQVSDKPLKKEEKKKDSFMSQTRLEKPQEQLNRENMHEIMIEDLDLDQKNEDIQAIHDTVKEDDHSFAFDLYRDMPEPRGVRGAQLPEDTVFVQEELKDLEPELFERETQQFESATNPSRTDGASDYRPQGADTFGASLAQGYTPQKAPHSFGMTEEYRTPDQKKADAFAVKPTPAVQQPQKPKKYIFPSLNLLSRGNGKNGGDSSKQLKETAARLQQTLKTFGVNVTITDISQGPAVTRYEMQPELGVKVSKIVSLADDIKLNLAATDIRIEAPIPGKAAVGIEVPNKENSAVHLRELLESDIFKKFDSNLAFAVGKDIAGQTVVFDIAKMPHVLIAGSTGSGKSVCINTLIMSILYKAHPDDVKLIMVDPKVVELSVYNGIPHLLIPVVTDPKKAAAALQWAVAEMTERYKKFADHNVRDLKGYNKLAEASKDSGDANAPVKMPQIVIIVDELADLMMVASGDVEEAIVRLAQLARAAGIHLVIATQRPSVDVITGLIKANMPSRIAFAVSSGVDSRTILDMNGAEKLLGKGDMLFYPQGYSKPARVQGAFVSDKEVSDVVDFLKNQAIGNVYGADLEEKIAHISDSGENASGGSSASETDELFAEAGRFIIEKDKASIGMLQRAFRIGFNRAARIMDQLADAGVVGEEEGTKPRKVLMSMEQFENYLS